MFVGSVHNCYTHISGISMFQAARTPVRPRVMGEDTERRASSSFLSSSRSSLQLAGRNNK